MATTVVRTRRQATPARWQAALARAIETDIQIRQIAGTGEWIATSGTRAVAYRTDGVSCECEAALLGGDPVCRHRAAYWHALGLLDLDPEPDPPAPDGAHAVMIDGTRYATRATREEADAVASSIRRYASTSTHIAVLAA